MFQLYKKRSFGDMISDTFSFLKTSGKHFFRNYFAITGVFLLVLLVLMYFLSKVYFDFIFSAMGTTYGQNPFESLFGENLPLFIVVVLVFILLAIFVSIINYSFPVSYMKLFEKNNQSVNFTSKDIINDMKSSAGKMVAYFFGLIFIFAPIMLVCYVILIFLSMILIGIPLMFIVLPALMSWVLLTLFFYWNSNEGFFASMGNAWRGLMSNFWPIVGSTVIVYIIVTVLTGIVIMIPYAIGVASVFGAGTTNGMQDPDSFSFFGIMMTVVMILSMLVSFITNNLFMMNQGVIYYSLIEQKENRTPQTEIDLIGTEE